MSSKQQRGSIRDISGATAQALCAAQVVVSLSAVVKELVENSIDAGASHISVQLVDGATGFAASVIDDGCGINFRDKDTIDNFIRHRSSSKRGNLNSATAMMLDASQASSTQHTTALASPFGETAETLGFRGEALHAISQIAHLSVSSKVASMKQPLKVAFFQNPAADEPVVDLGAFTDSRASGTKVVVENLFHSLPVRRAEFDRSKKKHVADTVQCLRILALSRPTLRIHCSHQQGGASGKYQTLLSVSGNSSSSSSKKKQRQEQEEERSSAIAVGTHIDLHRTLGECFTPRICVSLRRFSLDSCGSFSVDGFLSAPGTGRSSADMQFAFLDGRHVRLGQVMALVNDCFAGAHASASAVYPVVVLHFRSRDDGGGDGGAQEVKEEPVEKDDDDDDDGALSQANKNDPFAAFANKRGSTNSLTSRSSSSSSVARSSSKHQLTTTATRNYDINLAPKKDKVLLGDEASLILALRAALQAWLQEQLQEGSALAAPGGKTPQAVVAGTEKKSMAVKVEKLPEVKVEKQQQQQREDDDDDDEDFSAQQSSPRSTKSARPTVSFEAFLLKPKQQQQQQQEQEDVNKKPAVKTAEDSAPLPVVKQEQEQQSSSSDSESSSSSSSASDNDDDDDQLASEPQQSPVVAQRPMLTPSSAIAEERQRQQQAQQPQTPLLQQQQRSAQLNNDDDDDDDDDDAASPPTNQALDSASSPELRRSQARYIPRPLKKQSPFFSKPAVERFSDFAGDAAGEAGGAKGKRKSNKAQPKKSSGSRRQRKDDDDDEAQQQEGPAAVPASNVSWNKKAFKDAEDELGTLLSKEMFSQLRVLGQFNNGFILTVSEPTGNVFIFDQHASDEKFNYERNMANFTSGKGTKCQPLLKPEIVVLDEPAVAAALDNSATLAGLGFRVAAVDNDACSLAVSSVPVLPYDKVKPLDISTLCEQLRDYGAIVSPLRAVWHSAATLACRRSIMIGTPLDQQTMQRVVANLQTLHHPWNCPHGRPTVRHVACVKGSAVKKQQQQRENDDDDDDEEAQLLQLDSVASLPTPSFLASIPLPKLDKYVAKEEFQVHHA